jgi:alkylation response protein AidB-like acyl-CoA dehydrogenase
MDFDLIEEEEQLVAVVGSLLARESPPGRVRAAEATGFDPALWEQLWSLGVPSMSVGSSDEGAASLFQLALVAEQAGRALASAPVIEAFVAARLLERCGGPAAALLDEVCRVGHIATVSLRNQRGRIASLVPAGSVADIVIALDGEELVAVTSAPPGVPKANLGSLPLADRDLDAGQKTVLAGDAVALSAFDAACTDWKILSAAQLVGLAAAALEIGVGYAKSREVFGAPIATFQTIAHRLADDATAVDGARLLTYEAAWAVDEGRSRAEALASMAWCFASETSLNVTRDSLHYHGGYGVTTEYDIQLYFRRAKAYSLAWGDPRREYQRLADTLFGPRKAS